MEPVPIWPCCQTLNSFLFISEKMEAGQRLLSKRMDTNEMDQNKQFELF